MKDTIKIPKVKIRKKWNIHPETNINKPKKIENRVQRKKAWLQEYEDLEADLEQLDSDGC